ncbi:hypothetical protein BASA81_001704 [Batrachochytrium salamandrivorans]|nr:hypothetical protein BASA81_001704 [Batrachochytrium salamandrivorans]
MNHAREREEEEADKNVFDSPLRSTNRSSKSSASKLTPNRLSHRMFQGGGGVFSAFRSVSKQTATHLTRNPALAAKDTSQLTIKLFASTKCYQCKRQFNAEVGKRRYCRNCGEIFCFECCSARVRLHVYQSRIGLLTNNTSKAQLVCRPCLLLVLGNREEEEAQELTIAPQLIPPELPPRPNRRTSLTGALLPSQSRKPTLEKYMHAVKHGGVNLERGFKTRLQAKHQANQPAQVERSLTRAKTLRDGFFNGVNVSELRAAAAAAAPNTVGSPATKPFQDEPDSVVLKLQSFAEMKQAAQASSPASPPRSVSPSPQTASWGEYLSNLIRPSSPPLPSSMLEVDLDDGSEEITLEELLHTETLKFRKLAAAKDEIEERGRANRIKEMLAKLTAVQATKIAEFQRQTGLLDKQLRMQAKHLESAIRSGKVFGEDESHNVVDLRDELRNILLHLDNVQLESVFPACLRWKLKAKIDEGMFVGVRDLDIARFDAQFKIEVQDQRLVFSMSDICLDVALYEFEIRGDTAKAKVLRSALASTLNQVELSITGEYVLPLAFEEGGLQTAHSRWVADKDKSVFTMRLAKTAERKSKFQLPDSFLQWFASSLIPNLIENQILQRLPTKELGRFLCKSHNHLAVRGRFNITGDTTPQIWKAPLAGPTESSDQARRCMGFQSEDEAFIFDFILASTLAQTAGFDSKTGSISLAKLYAWRLRFAAHSLASLAPLLAIVEAGSKMSVPKNWTLQLLRRMDELAAKPLTMSINLVEVNLDLDCKELLTVITATYLDHVEENVAKEVELEAARVARKRRSKSVGEYVAQNPEDALRAAREVVGKLHGNFDQVLVPLVCDEIRTQFNAMIAGGSGGLFAFSFTEVWYDICLPERFTFQTLLFEAVELNHGFVLKVNGKRGLEPGEYGFRLNILPVGEEEEEEEEEESGGGAQDNDVETMLKNVKMELFTLGKPTGSIHVSMDAWRSTVLISSLIKFIISATAPIPASMQQPARSSLPPPTVYRQTSVESLRDGDNKHTSLSRSPNAIAAQTEETKELMIQSRRVVENLWGSFRAFELELEGDIASEQAGIAGINPLSSSSDLRRGSTAAPKHDPPPLLLGEESDYHQRVFLPYLTNDSFALHLDVRGLQLAFKKTRRLSGKEEERLRLTLVKNKAQTLNLVSFSMRINFQDIFQSDMLPI